MGRCKGCVAGVLALAVLLAGCAGVPASFSGAAAPAEGAGSQAQPVPGAALQLGGDVFAFRLQLAGTVVQLPCGLDAMEQQGWQLQAGREETLLAGHAAAAQMTWGALRLSVTLANTGTEELPLAECSVVGLALQRDTAGDEAGLALPGGIEWGTPRAQVLQLCGLPDSGTQGTEDPVLRYTAGRDAYLEFTFAGDALEGVTLYSLFAQAPLPEESSLPDAVRAWQAPAQLGEDAASFNIQYAGALYSLPAPVAAFMQNGWTLRDEALVEPGGFVMRVCLRKGNQVLRTTLHNYSHTAQPLTGCFVTMAEWARGSAEIPLVLPGGVTSGLDYDGVVALWGQPHELSRYGDNTWDIYYYYGEGMVIIRFSKQDDTLVDIEVWNEPEQLPLQGQ